MIITNFNEIFTIGGLAAVALTVIQIAPIHIDPWSWIFRSIGRALNREMLDKFDIIARELETIKTTEDERQAILLRTWILQFCDDLYKDEHHSKERFNQMLAYITEYNKYCQEHPDFPNERAKSSIKHIVDVYDEHLKHQDFL